MTDEDMDRELVIGARRILAAKLALQRSLPVGYVHDPAVHLLLHLYINHCEGRGRTHRAVCDEVASAPFSVTTRWLMAMEKEGLVRTTDAGVGRGEPTVGLTEAGIATVRKTVLAVGAAEREVRDDARRAASDMAPIARRAGEQ